MCIVHRHVAESMRAHDKFAVAVLNRIGSRRHSTALYRSVVPGGAGGAKAPSDFGRSVNPISTKGGRLYPLNNTGTPGFSALPTALSLYQSAAPSFLSD